MPSQVVGLEVAACIVFITPSAALQLDVIREHFPECGVQLAAITIQRADVPPRQLVVSMRVPGPRLCWALEYPGLGVPGVQQRSEPTTAEPNFRAAVSPAATYDVRHDQRHSLAGAAGGEVECGAGWRGGGCAGWGGCGCGCRGSLGRRCSGRRPRSRPRCRRRRRGAPPPPLHAPTPCPTTETPPSCCGMPPCCELSLASVNMAPHPASPSFCAPVSLVAHLQAHSHYVARRP